jgi:hypothetical protein
VELADYESLNNLVFNWGEAYIIDRPVHGIWVAVRRDDHRTLRAETPFRLREAIIADYSERPVPRGLVPAQRDGDLGATCPLTCRQCPACACGCPDRCDPECHEVAARQALQFR